MNGERSAEVIEAVTLLHDLGKPSAMIESQLDLTAAEVSAIVKTGQIPVRQKTLFADSSEPQKTKPVSRWDGVKRALEIHQAGKPTNRTP